MWVPAPGDSCFELIERCLAGEETAWIDFVARFQPAIALGAIKIARMYNDTGREAIDDLVQQTYLKIVADNCRLLRPFQNQPAAALGAYLRTIAANLARDHFMARHPERQAIPLDALAVREILGTFQDKQTVELQSLIDDVGTLLGRLPSQNPDRDRTMFWLYYRTGLTSRAIAAIPAIGMTAKGVESALQRMTLALRQAMGLKPRDNTSTDAKENPDKKGLGEGGFD